MRKAEENYIIYLSTSFTRSVGKDIKVIGFSITLFGPHYLQSSCYVITHCINVIADSETQASALKFITNDYLTYHLNG